MNKYIYSFLLSALGIASVDLYFQNISPGKGKENNWLPAPSGSFNLILRLYLPTQEFLSGNWTPPALKKSELISWSGILSYGNL